MFAIKTTNIAIHSPNPQNRLLIVRQNGIETITDHEQVIRNLYRELETEIDEGWIAGRNHLIAIFRYGENGDCLSGYTQKGTL